MEQEINRAIENGILSYQADSWMISRDDALDKAKQVQDEVKALMDDGNTVYDALDQLCDWSDGEALLTHEEVDWILHKLEN